MKKKKLNKQDKVNIYLSLVVAITIVVILTVAVVSAEIKDYNYVKCIEEKAKLYCIARGGVETFSPEYPHVICRGFNQSMGLNNIALEPNKGIDIYIFNESEILECWG